MGRTRVKDMPRSQQKAVFAKMTGDGYAARLESAEKYHRRRDLLRKKHDLAEETEDKIMDVWSNRKLTYRQKMAKIGKIKQAQQQKFAGHEKAETAPTIVGEIRKEKWRRFKKQAYLTSITEVPEGHDRPAFDASMSTRKIRAGALYSHEGLLLTQQEYVEGLKNKNRQQLPKGSRVTSIPPGMRKRAFDAAVFHSEAKKGSYIKVDGLVLKQSAYKKALRRNARVRYPHLYGEEKKKKGNPHPVAANPAGKYRVVMRTPSVGKQEGEWVKSKPMTKPEAEKLSKEMKHLGWKTAKVASPEKKTFGMTEVQKEKMMELGERGSKIGERLEKASVKAKKSVDRAKRNLERERRKMTYNQLKKTGSRIKPHTDSDKDGVPNAKDCRPHDSKKHYVSDSPMLVAYPERATKAAEERHSHSGYLEFAAKKNEQLRQGTISTKQYKKDMAAFRKKNMTYKQLKKTGSKVKPHADTDKDGVPNAKDCRPLDKTKQHGGRRMKKGTVETVIGNIAYARSPEGREKAARARIRKIETKRRAEKLEVQAKEAEQKYKKEHPSAFTRLRRNIAARRKKKSIYA